MDKKVFGELKMPICYQLVGIPGSGKSTWIANQPWAKDCVIVSTDNHVDDYAQSIGKTYDEVFSDYMPTAVNLMADDVDRAREAGRDIIWDQTSTTIQSRRRKFNMLRSYKHIAVVFKTPNYDELNRRLSSRPGKNIPDSVIKKMILHFDLPSEDEGFAEIWTV
jgi:predicted kinase